ncbi:MAG: NAD-dependent epimerase/dehydratase family protein [Nitrospirae bacterium]|nr:NAD-dependent epimerase/dehydratase family protein [Nitrospirota bacterium]
MHNFKSTDRILITGGTGFIGSCLAQRCLQQTPLVTCIDAGDKKISSANVEYIRADVSDKENLRRAFGKRTFDYVFNLSGYIDHTPYFKGGRSLIETHFAGLMNLTDCLDRESLKGFVQIGSSDEYGSAPAPQREDMRERPISPYSFAKTAASHFMQMLSDTEGFPGTVLRFFLVYGPGQDEKRFLPQIIKACLNNEEFKTSEGRQLRDFCYIDDAAEAMTAAALTSGARGHIINIASGTPVSIREMVEKVMKSAGGGKPLWGFYPYRKGENMELYADISLAKKILGWSPQTGIEHGLKKTIEYYRGER